MTPASNLKTFDVILLNGLGNSKCEFVVLGFIFLTTKIQIRLLNVESSQLVNKDVSLDAEFNKVGTMVFQPS